MAFEEVDVKQLEFNPFEAIEDGWMLVTAGDETSFNTMTANWGGLGVLWGEPVATCYIRQSRYTKEFVDRGELFSLSFFEPGEHRRDLGYLGRVSGRDEDKVAATGLSPVTVGGVAAFAEASLVLVCRKQYAAYLGPEGFTDGGAIDAKHYGDGDYHTMYIGAVEHAYLAESE